MKATMAVTMTGIQLAEDVNPKPPPEAPSEEPGVVVRLADVKGLVVVIDVVIVVVVEDVVMIVVVGP